jgi:hypothetical protein
MLDSLKKPREQVCFRDAHLLAAGGYIPAPTPFGHSLPDAGAWAVGRYGYQDSDRQMHPAAGISCLTGARPNAVVGLHSVTASWLVGVTVRCEHKGIAAAVDDLVQTRLVYRDGITSRFAPSRCTVGSLKRLYLYGLAAGEVPFNGRQSRYYAHPKSPGRYMSVELRSAAQQIVVSGLDTDNAIGGTDMQGPPYFWKNGLGLDRVRRDELPILGRDSADALVSEIENLFEAQGATWS